ncbi:MAG: hypothetical protein LBN27_10270 [Prevotellaceae bacterium]|nr:hypothetical protein [Prevotellaceae bacterium]
MGKYFAEREKVIIFAALTLIFALVKKEISKILLNISYLFIGGVLLTGIMKEDISMLILFLVGGLVPALMVSAALLLLWWEEKIKNKEKNKNNQ